MRIGSSIFLLHFPLMLVSVVPYALVPVAVLVSVAVVPFALVPVVVVRVVFTPFNPSIHLKANLLYYRILLDRDQQN